MYYAHTNVEYDYAIREILVIRILEHTDIVSKQIAEQSFELQKEVSMYGIDLLMKEHENIITFTEYLKKLCCDIIDGQEVDIKKICECIEFGKNYADQHHHGKEEKVLFHVMIEKLGPVAEKLIKNGMLVEHDLGRYHMRELTTAVEHYKDHKTTLGKLDIITHAAAYADLLKRHIGREDEVCYTFALRMLSEEDKKFVDEQTTVFENIAYEKGIQTKYETWLNDL